MGRGQETPGGNVVSTFPFTATRICRTASRTHRKPGSGWRTKLYEFGGGTRSSALHAGWYVDPDTKERVHDESCRYEVALPSRKVAQLRSVLREACGVFSVRSAST